MSDSKSKKRKRSEDVSSHAKKKPATAGTRPTGTAKVSSVMQPQFCPPVIATAPGLCVPSKTEFLPYASTEKPRSKSPAQAGGRELLLRSTSHRSLDYTAREDRRNGVGSLLNHYVATFDPKTGRLQVVEAKKMTIRGVVRDQQATAEAMAARTTRENMANLKNVLGESFGTKKAKKAIAAVTENAIAPRKGAVGEDGSPRKLDAASMIMMETIKETTANMATREELQETVNSARQVPRGNYDAEEVQDVYNPEEIIGKDVLDAVPVRDWQDAAKESKPVATPSRYISHRLLRVASNENAIQRLRLLRYMLWVLQFYQLARPGRVRGTKKITTRENMRKQLQPAPEVVMENIRRKFSENGEMRKHHIDLLVTHCCAFACILDSFEVNTYDLKEDLKLEQNPMNQYFQEIGARVKQMNDKEHNKSNWIAKLSLPLQFPRLRVQVNKRR